MNTDSVQVLKKRLNDVDANMALCRILGFISGYVPGNVTITEQNQQYVLNRVLEILNDSKK